MIKEELRRCEYFLNENWYNGYFHKWIDTSEKNKITIHALIEDSGGFMQIVPFSKMRFEK